MEFEGYTTLSRLGQGAATVIYKVRCNRTKKVYALKQIKRDNDTNGRVFEQVENEYRISQQVNHRNVRKTVELRRVRKLFRTIELQLIMEYLNGKTLEVAHRSDVFHLVGIFYRVARGLRAIHEAGYVHADIKPNNIMLCGGSKVKIMDLGQGCPIAAVKQRIQGTPDFIAPEQVLKMPLDDRTDVFNLGATMYWCLTGKFFPTRLQSKRTETTVNLGGVSEARSPQELNVQVPSLLSNLVMDCCRNSPSSRPESMLEIKTKLKACAELLKRQRKQALSKGSQASEIDTEP